MYPAGTIVVVGGKGAAVDGVVVRVNILNDTYLVQIKSSGIEDWFPASLVQKK